jgi:hypothetical protein
MTDLSNSSNIEYALQEASVMYMDKEHALRFVIRNVPGVSEDTVKSAYSHFIDKKFHVNVN